MRLMSLTTPNLYCFPAEQQAQVARIANEEAIELAKKHPDRVRALASLPLDDIPASLAELDRVAKIREVVGIAIGSNVNGVPLSDDRFEPVWKKINEYRMPVVEHPMFPTFAKDLPEYNLALLMGFYFDTQIMVTRMILNGIFARYPDFPFIVAHTGAGMLGIIPRVNRVGEVLPEVKAKLKGKSFADYAKNLYYDTCTFYGPTIAEACRFAGPDKVMFGTDYPFVDQTLKHVDPAGLAVKDKAGVDGDNAARVFGLR
jgi:aminocarboxymuconate-semialdehyde decarboxylase